MRAFALRRSRKNYFVPPQTQVLAYDADGNLTGDGVWSYTRDAENRLVRMASVLNETKSIKVQCGSVTAEYRVEISQSPPWALTFSGLGMEGTQFSGSDLFEALITLRRELERLGAKPLCAGARIDVFPSAMSRSMAGGRKAYITRLGAQSRRHDLIDIFDEAAPEHVASVAEQNTFHEKWFDSLGK